jgi:hypothetical protein
MSAPDDASDAERLRVAKAALASWNPDRGGMLVYGVPAEQLDKEDLINALAMVMKRRHHTEATRERARDFLGNSRERYL